MNKSRPFAEYTTHAAPPNWRSKSSPEGFRVGLRDLTTTSPGSETMGHDESQRMTNAPPTTFRDILSPQLITTSTLSEAGYMGYRKSKSRFRSTRSATFPTPQTLSSQTIKHTVVVQVDQQLPPTSAVQRDYTSTSRRLTLKRVMHSIKRSITLLNDSKKKKIRLPIPSSGAFATTTTRNSQSRFGTGPGRQSLRRQDGGEYLSLSDAKDTMKT